jgi:hypothetical protein
MVVMGVILAALATTAPVGSYIVIFIEVDGVYISPVSVRVTPK